MTVPADENGGSGNGGISEEQQQLQAGSTPEKEVDAEKPEAIEETVKEDIDSSSGGSATSNDPATTDTSTDTTTKEATTTTPIEDKKQEEDDENKKNDEVIDAPSPPTSTPTPTNWFHACTDTASRKIARNPCIFLLASLAFSIGLSVIGFTVGDFSVAADNAGWQSRGTLIADRHTQYMLVDMHRSELFYDTGEEWENLQENVQPGWETDDSISDRRVLGDVMIEEYEYEDEDDNTIDVFSLLFSSSEDQDMISWKQLWKPNADYMTFMDASSIQQSSTSFQHEQRQLDKTSATNTTTTTSLTNSSRPIVGDGTPLLCEEEIEWYLFNESKKATKPFRLSPVWKVKSSATALSSETIRDICNAEVNTQTVLEDRGLCKINPCTPNKCYIPFSVVLYARLHFTDGMTMDCEELSEAWDENGYQQVTEERWKQCVSDIHETYTTEDTYEFPSTCPIEFHPLLVNDNFDTSGRVSYTTSVFASREDDIDAMYDIVDKFDRGGGTITGAYDTQQESFGNTYADTAVSRDMSLAVGSAIITALAIVIHTRSLFLTGLGLLQIILSFPLAYFVYVFLVGLKFFPFLNFIGVFVVFALGADDIFVAVDKWKNARLEHPTAMTEDIAAIAFPNAAEAMFLTTITTAIAFFGTAICPVAPIKMFAVFCGLLIMFDYLLNILLVFPALCIYDRKVMANTAGCCISCCDGKKSGDGDEENNNNDNDALDDDDDDARNKNDDTDDDEEKPSLIRRILLTYYKLLHTARWPLLVMCMIAFGICTYIASTLSLPTSADVRLISDKHQFEQHFLWKLELLDDVLKKSGGSLASVIWGVVPADTGDLDDPKSWSQLVLDDRFDASPEDAQIYLKDICASLFAEDFASPPESTFVCPLTEFDEWLQASSSSSSNDMQENDIYTNNCNGATSLPVDPEYFDRCIIAWSQSVGQNNILAHDGKVKIITLPFTSNARWDDPFDVLEKAWNRHEAWFGDMNINAPATVNRGYFSSNDFHWYDTNRSMLSTAYGSAAIALSAAALIIALSSRSIVLTLFCTVTITYVLTSVTACLVGLGWTLGFLESICFAILIGVSVDFVIHFTHAYANLPGDTGRSERTKFALVHMGPSILAAAVTTIASATIMLFTVIIFFQKFALILFLTVIQATIGSFVVFLTMTDTIGPNQPTYLADHLAEQLCSKGADNDNNNDESNGDTYDA
eukprot:CAMPEP_0119547884 /NCGR_PEP_ID=MMETSP1352-20130426/1904_1 /TAXON_ID=265584 /ORGANISM="Stauroneis constricta, Strain CCMP1120" /LENGTH=1198 /DNA_ID=CAMNT_0007592951 /DNA_START=90 /DNA_END=3686 /DNA_ORIENTATION=-